MPEGYRPPSHGGNTASSIVPGAVATLRNGDAAATGSGTAATAGGGAAGGAAVARTRDGRQLSGTAVARPYSNVRYVSFPLYGPWGYSYPWYGWGFNYGFGYVNYNPWYYPGTHWIYGRYGYWYDPFAYDPYSYNMSYGAYGGTSDSGYSGGRDPYERRTGSVRTTTR